MINEMLERMATSKTSPGPVPEPRPREESDHPCHVCGSPFAWVSAYGDQHCWECSHPPAAGVVEIRLALITLADGSHEWEEHPRDRWEPR